MKRLTVYLLCLFLLLELLRHPALVLRAGAP